MDTTNLKNRLETKVQSIQETASFDSSNTSLAMFPALEKQTLDIIRENLKHQSLSPEMLDIVKSPSGGSTVFSVPGLNGEEAEKELTGIILDYTTPRAYWDTPDPIEGTPPVCLSLDSIISHEGKSCAHCPYNDFGSKDGESNAKACKESVLLFLLRPNNILPTLVRIPVTSKPRFMKYLVRLLSSMTPINGVVTKITLEKATSKTGKPYALFNFEAVDTLSADESTIAKTFGRQLMENMNTTAVISKPEEVS